MRLFKNLGRTGRRQAVQIEDVTVAVRPRRRRVPGWASSESTATAGPGLFIANDGQPKPPVINHEGKTFTEEAGRARGGVQHHGPGLGQHGYRYGDVGRRTACPDLFVTPPQLRNEHAVEAISAGARFRDPDGVSGLSAPNGAATDLGTVHGRFYTPAYWTLPS